MTEQELQIVNTKIFQRLHLVRQLGTGFLVYPGATHTRFSHCLGTMFVMDKVAQRLSELEIITDNSDIEKLRLAALLHDLGHFPFSHCLETPIEKNPQGKSGNHEQLAVHLIRNTSIKDKLGSFKPEEISSLITKEYVKQPLYSLLISSDLDVDRIDYLKRDSYATGVSYGYIDIDRIILTLRTDKDQHLAVEDKGRQALENFLLARYHMYQVVYYHKTVVGFELMLQKVYRDLIQDGLAYDYGQICKLSEDEMYDFNDSYVLNLLKEHQKDHEPIAELIARFCGRKRLKMIKEIQAMSFSGTEKPEYTKLNQIELPVQLSLLSEKCGVPKDWIFYKTPKPLSILSKADDETAIRVIKKTGGSIPIAKDKDSIIASLYESSFVSARVYTKDEYEKALIKGIKDCFAV